MMQLTYLAHSSFLVRCGDTKLVFDPWLKDPAYHGQWFLWPLASQRPDQVHADAVIITHGHEDHLHTGTLRHLGRKSTVFFPFQWRGGAKKYLHALGFEKVVEAVSFRKYQLNEVTITYIGFSLESVVVIEYRGEVLVNINDALNSNHETAVEFMLAEIKSRWPRIDYLLSGWSGAGYFPNQVRYPGKDDEEIGRMREQYFANNFCRFTEALQPRCAVPFAPGFILLAEPNKWINRIKFPRKSLPVYYSGHYRADREIRFLVPFPGDDITARTLTRRSPLHVMSDEEQLEAAYEHYSEQEKEANRQSEVDEKLVNNLVAALARWANYNKRLYHPRVIEDVYFSIRLTDVTVAPFINITNAGNHISVDRSATALPGKKLLVTTSGARLLYALGRPWGGDIITIGYGLQVEVYDEPSLEKNLDIVCIRLITRYPVARQDLLRNPLRALKYYGHNPALTTLWLRQKIMLKPYVNKYPYNERDHWLTYKKCDLCAVCKMPEIDLAALAVTGNNERAGQPAFG